MTELTRARLTIPEAAFVSGLPIRDINREIDACIFSPEGRSERRVRGSELFYLYAIKAVRTQIDPTLRKSICRAITGAVTAKAHEATVYQFVFSIDRIRQDLLIPFEALERAKTGYIAQQKDVLGGEPVIKGTRIAARHVADLIRRGASRAEIRDDLDLKEPEIDAAIIFDQTHPKRGRPLRHKPKAVHVPAS